MKNLTFIFAFLLSMNLSAQDSIFGKWKTIDEESGEAKAVVDIYERDGKVYGKITRLFRGPNEVQDPLCDKCKGDDFNKKIIGMEIIRDMEPDGDQWEDGTILDAEEGKTYTCKLWLENGVLKVRGYIAFFYRTQEWLRYKG